MSSLDKASADPYLALQMYSVLEEFFTSCQLMDKVIVAPLQFLHEFLDL